MAPRRSAPGCGRAGALSMRPARSHRRSRRSTDRPRRPAIERPTAALRMMQAIRGKAGSIVVKVLFALLILSFGVWGIGDYLSASAARPIRWSPRSATTDPGRRIADAHCSRPLERMRAQFGSADRYAAGQAARTRRQTLGQLIDRSLLEPGDRAAELDVSDDLDPQRDLRATRPSADRTARSTARLFNAGADGQPAEPRTSMSRGCGSDIPRNDLLQAVDGRGRSRRVRWSSRSIEYRNEKRAADIVAFPVSAVTDVGEPSEDELKQFYEAHPDLFRAPEYRGFTVGEPVARTIWPTASKSRKTSCAARIRRAQGRAAAARTARGRADPGADRGQGEGSRSSAGRGQGLARGRRRDRHGSRHDRSRPVEAARKCRTNSAMSRSTCRSNKPSEPVKTPFGWHILRVVKIEPGKAQTFEEAKPKLVGRSAARDRRSTASTRSPTRSTTRWPAAPRSSDAAEIRIEADVGRGGRREGQDPEGSRSCCRSRPTRSEAVFATAQGQTSRVTDTQDGAIYVARVDKVIPSAVKPLAEVREKAVAAWQAEQKQRRSPPNRPRARRRGEAGRAAGDSRGREGADGPVRRTLGRTPEPGRPFRRRSSRNCLRQSPARRCSSPTSPAATRRSSKRCRCRRRSPEDEAEKLTHQLAGDMRLDSPANSSNT